MSLIPVLDARADTASCDYPLGSYACALTKLRSGSTIRAAHRLDGAPALSALVEAGSACFAVEIRSTTTFTSQLHRAVPRETWHDLTLDTDVLAREGGQALPGLMATRDCSLSLADCTETWRQLDDSTPVRAGQWLARAQHSDLQSPQQSLITFVADKAMQRGELRRRFVHTDYPHYEVSMHSADLAACQANEGHPAVKVIMLAAWTAALADAASHPAFTGGESDGGGEREPLGDQLAAIIKDADPECAAPGEEDYDPLRAATLLVGKELVVFDEEDDGS